MSKHDLRLTLVGSFCFGKFTNFVVHEVIVTNTGFFQILCHLFYIVISNKDIDFFLNDILEIKCLIIYK